MKGLFRKCFVLIFFLITVFAEGQSLEGFEFVNKDIREVLYALSLFSGKNISVDDTVSGNVTFRCAGQDFESAFDSFLKAERLFVEKKDNNWIVSRVNFVERADNVIQLTALDVNAGRLIEKISERFAIDVFWESLPESEMSLRVSGDKAEIFIQAFVRQLGKNYTLEVEDNIYRICKANQNNNFRDVKADLKNEVKVEGDLISVNGSDSLVSGLLEELFRLTKKEYLFAFDSAVKIKRIKFQNKNFEQALGLICEGAGLKYFESDGIIYIYSLNAQTGEKGKSWKIYSLKNLHNDEVINILENVYGKMNIVKLPDGMSFMCLTDSKRDEEIYDFINRIDVPKEYQLVTLKYINSNQFLTHLPPGINASQFKQTSSDNTLFFTGSREEYEYLETSILNIDLPVKRISYDLLVLQYQYSNEENWESTVSASLAGNSDGSQAAAALGSVLSLKLDVLTTFGYRFAASLQTAINENRAQVFADTSLSGVSGGVIKFQNTNTYRYRDNNLNPETGEPIYSGVTREISSGLEIEVKGWVSGDGMITSSISASVSRQGVDNSASTGNPPPTSEKIITTEVRGKSGEVIVLSGLLQDEVSLEESGVPGLRKIPLLGYLFKSRKKTNVKTELIIYLVPHWLKDQEPDTVESDEDFCERILKEHEEKLELKKDM